MEQVQKLVIFFGDTLSATLYKYRDGNTYEDVDTDFITLSASKAANVVGTENILDGYDFSTATGTNGEFKVTIGTTQYIITLDVNALDDETLANSINTAFVTADSVGGVVNISSMIEAVAMKQTATESYLMLKKMGGSGTGFSLEAGDTNDALAIFGITVGSYTDANGIVGTWNAETIVSGNTETFSGIFGYTLLRTATSALSF